MKTIMSPTIIGVIVLGASLAGAEEPVPVGLQKQLFVDDYVVEDKKDVTLEVGVADKQGIVMKPTLVTDFQFGKIHDDPDGLHGPDGNGVESHFCWFISPHWNTEKKLFQLWYLGSVRPNAGLAYAESKDGINWTKPLVSKDGTSNLCNWNETLEGKDLLKIGVNGLTVVPDARLPYGHPEKFKVAFYPLDCRGGCVTRLGYSSDGINWNCLQQG